MPLSNRNGRTPPVISTLGLSTHGDCMNYSERLKDPRWQQMRLRTFERDNWKCRLCGQTGKTLHAHHAAYHPLAEGPWDYDPETIITLCNACHADQHANLKIAQANVLTALAKAGVWSEVSLDLIVDVISRIDFERSSPDHAVMKTEA